jgi:hypothetical protein
MVIDLQNASNGKLTNWIQLHVALIEDETMVFWRDMLSEPKKPLCRLMPHPKAPTKVFIGNRENSYPTFSFGTHLNPPEWVVYFDHGMSPKIVNNPAATQVLNHLLGREAAAGPDLVSLAQGDLASDDGLSAQRNHVS